MKSKMKTKSLNKERKEKKCTVEKKKERKEEDEQEKKLIRSGESTKQHPWALPVATGSAHPCCSPKWPLKLLHQSPLLPVATARNRVGRHGPRIESKNTSVLDNGDNKFFDASSVAKIFNECFTGVATKLVDLLPSGIFSTSSLNF